MMRTGRVMRRRGAMVRGNKLIGTLLCAILAVSLSGVSPAWASGSAPYFTALAASGSTELQTAREFAVAAPLPDGQVLIAGGQSVGGLLGGGPLRSAELFDPANDTFTALAASGATELQTARIGAVAAPLPDGQVLIAGGASGGPLRSAELFDPANDTFTALAASGATELQTARIGAVAAPLPDGQVLIAGGASVGPLRSAELFDPANDTFTALAASGATELQTAREDAVAAPLPDGQVLIAGGQTAGVPLQSAELFDPANDTFTALPASGSTELQTAREDAVAAPLPDGQVLIAGGNAGGSLQSAELFDPANDTFTALTASGSTELQTARGNAVAAPLPDGQVLIAGGASGASPLQSAEMYSSAPQAAVAGGDFGDQTVGQPSPASAIVVTNVGAQALWISGDSIAVSADSADFAIIADACSGRTLAFEQSCTISAQFTPSTTGSRTAAIALSDNESTASVIALTGDGVAANSGLTGAIGLAGATGAAGVNGATGLPGATGAVGARGATGLPGATGTAGPSGPAGEVEIVTCKSVTTGKAKHKKTLQKCATKLTSSPVTFTTTRGLAAAVLSRGDVVYATGSAIRLGTRSQLLLRPLHAISAGRYLLTLTHGREHQRETITIA